MEKTFENLAQRGIYYFLVSMPPFHAVESESATKKDQENAYNFIWGIYEKLYKDPTLLGLKNLPDDCYPDWWTPKKEKPGLPTHIRGIIKAINIFVETLYHVIYFGESDGNFVTVPDGSFEVKPAMLKKFALFGVTAVNENGAYRFTFPEGTIKGLKLLASVSAVYAGKSANTIHNKQVSAFLLFSHGVFDPGAPYTAEIFRSIFKDHAAFDKLIDYFEKNRFIRVENKEYKTGLHCEPISLDYVKIYGKPEGIIGSAWKTRNFSGVGFEYNEMIQSLATIGVHIPFFREVLENADKMSESLREFVSRNNKCSSCGYCVQTDKSKTKPLRFRTVNGVNICTLFTFGYTFNQFYEDMWLTDGIIELMDFADKLFKDRLVDDIFN